MDAQTCLFHRGPTLAEFLKSGGIYQTGREVHCFWGASSRGALRPDGPGLYAPDFFLDDAEPWWSFENSVSVSLETLRKALAPLRALESGTLSLRLPQKDGFFSQFEEVQRWIREGAVEKAVPFVFTEGHWDGSSQEFLRHALANGVQSRGGHLYGLWQDQDFILGRSPEILVEQQGETTWESMALAGTTSWDRFESQPKKFLQDPKEIMEQGLVVRFLEEKLQSLGRLDKKPREAVRAGTLAHLLTRVQLVTPNPVSLSTLIETLHPTPALGCYPATDWKTRLRTLGWRGRYGAPFGLSLSSDRAHVIVAIRNFQKREGTYVLGTGCGVIQASEREKEWAELNLKRLSVLGIFNL